MDFKIEQVALCPPDPQAAIKLLNAMGAGEWANDHVVASGEVFSEQGTNEADLFFNYTMLEGAKELEILSYTTGPNWMDKRPNRVSHLGMHCTMDELRSWIEFFIKRGITIAQAVFTQSHTNPVIKNKRRYNYVIFDTYDILGVDIKFIVRIDE